MTKIIAGSAMAVALLLGGCGEETPTGGGTAGSGGYGLSCRPSETQPCLGTNACRGTQSCAGTGKAWSVCLCPGDEPSTSSGGASGGTTGGGGSVVSGGTTSTGGLSSGGSAVSSGGTPVIPGGGTTGSGGASADTGGTAGLAGSGGVSSGGSSFGGTSAGGAPFVATGGVPPITAANISVRAKASLSSDGITAGYSIELNNTSAVPMNNLVIRIFARFDYDAPLSFDYWPEKDQAIHASRSDYPSIVYDPYTLFMSPSPYSAKCSFEGVFGGPSFPGTGWPIIFNVQFGQKTSAGTMLKQDLANDWSAVGLNETDYTTTDHIVVYYRGTDLYSGFVKVYGQEPTGTPWCRP